MFFSQARKLRLPTAEEALPGRSTPLSVPETHYVSGHRIVPPFPEGHRLALFGLGCFWGAERVFWKIPGVYATSVGYAGGHTPNPTYEEVCSGRTGHNEVVQVVYDPDQVSYRELLKVFFESHDPTQGMRQGNDVGTQYRSGIYTHDDAQEAEARGALETYAAALKEAGFPEASTELRPAPKYYYAEGYHQQYLAKNPSGYCGLGGTGISCPVGA